MASPFKSKAQMERMKKLVGEGTLTQAYFDECLALTQHVDKLPDRLHPKKEEKAKDTQLDFGEEPKE